MINWAVRSRVHYYYYYFFYPFIIIIIIIIINEIYIAQVRKSQRN